MDILNEYEANGYVYEVCYDDNPENFDWILDEQERKEYMKRFTDMGDLNNYIVFKKKICNCCNMASQIVDSCGGIHAASSEEALEQYLNDNGEGE